MRRKILITGGAGFVGSNLVRYLAEAGAYDLRVLDNLSVGQAEHGLPSSATFIRGDFTDRKTLVDALDGTEVVVHLAALSGVIDSINDPRPSFAVNVLGSFQLLDLARKAGVRRVINASTGGAILGDVPPPISESMPPAPLSPYGASKLAVEGYCSAFSGAYGLPCASLRFSNIYGPRSAHKKSVVAAFIKNVLRNEPLVVYGDGSQQRDYLYVGDLVRGIKAAIDSDVSGPLQLGSGRPASLHELINALQIVVGRKLDVRFEKARRGEVRATWCDISAAARKFAFAPRTNLEAGLRETWSWFMENRELAMRSDVLSSSE